MMMMMMAGVFTDTVAMHSRERGKLPPSISTRDSTSQPLAADILAHVARASVGCSTGLATLLN